MGMFPSKVVKVRKERVCEVCQGVIPVGTSAKSCAGVVDKKFVAFYEHVDQTVCDGNLAQKAHS